MSALKRPRIRRVQQTQASPIAARPANCPTVAMSCLAGFKGDTVWPKCAMGGEAAGGNGGGDGRQLNSRSRLASDVASANGAGGGDDGSSTTGGGNVSEGRAGDGSGTTAAELVGIVSGDGTSGAGEGGGWDGGQGEGPAGSGGEGSGGGRGGSATNSPRVPSLGGQGSLALPEESNHSEGSNHSVGTSPRQSPSSHPNRVGMRACRESPLSKSVQSCPAANASTRPSLQGIRAAPIAATMRG
mmetsp:Transcript_66975/g.200090  ORF Transcript_66975/g.200090 Transcript_66975/m.200090 type:complete len:243 (+) Transcript_66975:427-1155(+)